MSGVTTRLIEPGDATALAGLLTSNRDFLAPWSPRARDEDFTPEGQREVVGRALDAYERGWSLPLVILDVDGELVGRVTLNSIIRGAFQSASLGYWVAQDRNGRGIATAAAAAAVRHGFDSLALHRVQAETLPHNLASRRVLERNGFVEYGRAPDYLNIDGRWQENVLYQLVNPDWSAP